ncbi:four-carbon acid sugar kinase family protein [Terribacillus saccharophilus]|uniref:four-carbon acid sugar kinase family protein n=1 Tax=Terribacillus saccharophilus TaxID=361277 RepID=UPI001483B77C|nr:four-carbon acid sugar kinase family protein [Terribacillus saccharophilus]
MAEQTKRHIDDLKRLRKTDKSKAKQMLDEALQSFNKKIIVLDDDPTGVQTIHGISVYTDWTVESIREGFKEKNSMFFILTNSRAFTAQETELVHQDIASSVSKIAKEEGKEFIIISRGDSTLRGHYPLETDVLKQTVEKVSGDKFDGEVIFPFFKEGGRYTLDNIHYVQNEDSLIPAGMTEFAKDRTFGFTHSHLGEWVEEKTEGEYQADKVTYLSLDMIRAMDIDALTNQLMQVKDFNKIVINAVEYTDVQIAVTALIRAMNAGKKFMFRTAASLTKVIGGVSDRALLSKQDLITENESNGGLILVGSHVKKTTQQLEQLKKLDALHFIEFNTHLVLENEAFSEEFNRVLKEAEMLIKQGRTVAVYTRRERLDLGPDKKEEELQLSVKISKAVTNIVTSLSVRPRFIVAKGGITSSDIGVNGLAVKRATVAGQIKPGIPVWVTGKESKFPGIAYVIFPGNVGEVTTLKEVIEELAY